MKNLNHYHFASVQNLIRADSPARLPFVRIRQNLDLDFLSNVMSFLLADVFLILETNPHGIMKINVVNGCNFLHQFEINVGFKL